MHLAHHKPDYIIIISLAILIIFGIVMFSSVSVVKAYKRSDDVYYYLKHQLLLGLLPGVLVLTALYYINYKFLKKISLYLIVFGVALLTMALIPPLSLTHASSKSWINLGFITIQPAEIIKLLLIIYLAAWFDKYKDRPKEDDSSRTNYRYSKTKFKINIWRYISVITIVSTIFGLILAQPDVGTLLILFFIVAAMCFIAEVKIRYFILTGLIAIILIGIAMNMAPYRMQRLNVFLHPELDPQGSGYQINQALLAIGSGGLLGRGFGESRQKFQYLPEVLADSTFAIVAEELGFLISAGIIVIFLIFMYRGLLIAKKAPDLFGRLIATGIVAWILCQAFLNIMGISNLMPLTGIPLPFISYGGTALISAMAGIGILLNISKQTV